MNGAAHFVPNAINVDGNIFYMQRLESRNKYANNKRVIYRIRFSQYLDSRLPKFPLAAGLRIFMPKKSAFIKKLHRLRPTLHTVFQISSHNGRCAFGTQNQSIAAASAECVHLLFHDIGGFSQWARKEF